MLRTFHIDDSSPKAKAFLEFIKSLGFVTEADNSVLSDSQLGELELRRTYRQEGKSTSHSWQDVQSFAKKSFH